MQQIKDDEANDPIERTFTQAPDVSQSKFYENQIKELIIENESYKQELD